MRKSLCSVSMIGAIGAVIVLVASGTALAQSHTSRPFVGPKANTGTVTHSIQSGKHVLTLSDDFKAPDTPDPHWQVVDTKGQVYLLDKLMIKGDVLNKSITLPAYIRDVAKVQMWCAWAVVNLGEATFAAPITTN
jgi:hypothetical protein